MIWPPAWYRYTTRWVTIARHRLLPVEECNPAAPFNINEMEALPNMVKLSTASEDLNVDRLKASMNLEEGEVYTSCKQYPLGHMKLKPFNAVVDAPVVAL